MALKFLLVMLGTSARLYVSMIDRAVDKTLAAMLKTLFASKTMAPNLLRTALVILVPHVSILQLEVEWTSAVARRTRIVSLMMDRRFLLVELDIGVALFATMISLVRPLTVAAPTTSLSVSIRISVSRQVAYQAPAALFV